MCAKQRRYTWVATSVKNPVANGLCLSNLLMVRAVGRLVKQASQAIQMRVTGKLACAPLWASDPVHAWFPRESCADPHQQQQCRSHAKSSQASCPLLF